MISIILILLMFLLGVKSSTGQNFQDELRGGNPNPQMRRLSSLNNYVKLPDNEGIDNYDNPNATTRYIQSNDGFLSVGPNFRLHPTIAPGNQSEVIIYASPLNPNLVFAAAVAFWGGSGYPVGGYASTNGGINWYGTDTLSILSYGDPGPIIDKNNIYIISYLHISGRIGTSYSTNFGLSWSAPAYLPGSSTSSDKCLSGTNYAATSPYYGHSYTVYTEFEAPYENRIVFSRTTNSGVSWTTVIPISPPTSPALPAHQGADVTAGPEGNIYAIWAKYIGSFPNYLEDSLGFAKSTDGGITWTTRNNAADMNGIRTFQYGPWPIGVTSFPRMDIDRTGGERNGWIYVVAPEKNFSSGDVSDIFLWRSTDQGTTFSAPIRVNQDLADGKLQFQAAINVDLGGGVNVIYHDCRSSNENDSVDTYVSRSIDGGNTWTDIKANDAKFRPNNSNGNWIGDYIGITSTDTKIIPNWADNRTGRYQSWATLIDLPPVGIQNIGSEIPKYFYLSQNYPNPFNPTTKIKFAIPPGTSVAETFLSVYDVLGKEIAVLVNERLQPGAYEVNWDASNYPSGVYFYKLIVHQTGTSTGDYSEIKKMVLIK